MSSAISAFPPQSSGGGGVFVLKCVANGSFTYTQAKAFSAPYGGIIYIHTDGSSFTINSIDGTSPTITGSFQNADMYRSSVNGSSAEYIIPFGSYCELYGKSGTYAVQYTLYKYELI